MIDYSGAVGSIYYSINDGITNPIVPLAPGCTPQNAVTGAIGNNFALPALKASCFTVPLLLPCNQPNAAQADGPIPCSAIPPGDTFETNFIVRRRTAQHFPAVLAEARRYFVREAWPRDGKGDAQYSFDVFNLTNHPSFDIPIDNIDQNLAFSPFPVATRRMEPAPRPTLASGCNTANPSNGFYFCPTGLGQVVKTIGSSRQIQMSLSVLF